MNKILIFLLISSMGFLATSLRWGVKVGVAGGVVYAAGTQGLFGSADATLKGYEGMKKLAQDNVNFDAVVVVVPEGALETVEKYLPKRAEINNNARGYWNSSVLFTCSSLAATPDAVKRYSSDLVKFVQSQLAENSEEKKAEKQEEKTNN